MDRKLAALPPETTRPKSCPRCGKNARLRAKEVPRTFSSLSGSHTIKRNYHYCEDCKHGFYPVDYLLGLPEEGDASVELERRMADFSVNDVFEAAEARWALHYPQHSASANQFRQVAKRLGAQVEEASPELLQSAYAPPFYEKSATLYVMTDGGMVPTREGWKEVKVGMVFRQENHLSRREAKRGIVSTARYVAHPNQESFKSDLKAAVSIENAIGAEQAVYLGDGAPENWAVAADAIPFAVQILDWYHAIENAMRCGKALLGENDGGLASWATTCEHLIYEGSIDVLVEELMGCIELTTNAEQLQALDALVRYVRNNQGRMQYAAFAERGFLIGSGPVESAHRHVIQTRMKKAGQRWGQRGARQMARLRAAYRTAGPSRFYDSIRWAHRETMRAKPQLQHLAAKRKPPKRYASNR